MTSGVLTGTTVHVLRWRVDDDFTMHGPLTKRIEDNGGRIIARIARDVTHVIFQAKVQGSSGQSPEAIKIFTTLTPYEGSILI